MRVYHILSHTLEDFYPEKLKTLDDFSFLEHTINRFVSGIIKYGDSTLEHIVVIPSRDYKTQSKPIRHKDGYDIYIIHAFSLGFPFEFSFDIISFIRDIQKEDIIHIYGTSSFLYDFLSPFLIWRKSIAHYMWGHFTWKFFPFSFLKYIILQPITLRFPKILLVQNKYRIEKYKRHYKIDSTKMQFLPVAVTPWDFPTKDTATYNQSRMRFLFIGRLERAKWIPELITVFLSLSKEFPWIELSIAGTGSMVDYIHKISAKNDIKYLWNINQNTLWEIYRKHDVFVLPTHFDCFPSVLVEAGMSGLASISTTVEWPQSIILEWKTWILIPPKNIDTLMQAMRECILHPEWVKEMWINAAAHTRKNFSWEKIIQVYMNTYHNL